ncbi:MAG: toprim domain-containing protein [Deltaproteobacteria bacterium]|nr:toprim domain-containing protein [Deltaproteobacteria bacterium]
MARIPEAELERLKREISVERLAQARGVTLQPHGANLIGLCPFHDDHAPSFVVTPTKNLWHCLGACQQGGSVIDFVMKAEGVSFRHAVELLRADLPTLAAGSAARRIVKDSSVTKLPPPVERDAADHELLTQVVAYYHATLQQSPEALQYLERRGLCSSEMLARFQLGFANRTLAYRLPAKNRQAGAALRGRLQRLGILRESGHEHFNGSIVIPIVDEHGHVSELYGRKITPQLRKGTPLHLYLPGPHRGVWNLEALQASKEIILCEALLDALTFWCAGFRNVTASYGVEGFTDDHLAALQRYGTARVLIAYDRDAAGEKAAEKLAEKLIAAGIECFRVQFPKGMDANAYVLKVTPAPKSLGVLLRHAQWMGKGAPPTRPLTTEPAIAEPAAAAAKEEGEYHTTPEPVEIESHPLVEPQPAFPLAAEPTSPALPAMSLEIPTEIKPEEIVIRLGDRKYRVRGLAKNLSYEQLRVNVLCAQGDAFHVDTLDLYSARQRALYIKQAAEELALKEDVIKKDLGKVLLKLEELQEAQIRKALEPPEQTIALSEAEQAAALDLLKDPQLLDRILADFEKCGVVGEETNKLVGYLAAVSRKLDEPLAVIIQSSSAAGKTSLMDAILAFMPDEERVKYSAMTGQSLFYLGETDLKHKILAIVEEAGAERASYALKLLQSEGELTIASTGKDPTTGKLVTHEYRVEGPVMIFLTTTAVEIDDELLNRCLVLTVNEDREQTRAIHRLQRERQTLDGLLARHERERLLTVHRNAQRLLRPLWVVNPYARELTFLDTRTRTRRDHVKYLTLIRTIALLHQHQRPVQIIQQHGQTLPYIEVTRDDIALANRLAHEVLGRSLDELAPQTRRLLTLLDSMVTEACRRLAMDRSDYRFSRKDVRQHVQWTDFQVKTHMRKLEDLEYVLVHRGGRGQSFVYELLYAGQGGDGQPFLMGLLDPDTLGHPYDGKKEHPSADVEHRKPKKEPARSIQGAPKEPPSSIDPRGPEPLSHKAFHNSAPTITPNASLAAAPETAPSYVPAHRTRVHA